MSVIQVHKNQTEITGLTCDGTWRTKDLSPFLKNQCSCGVVVSFVHTAISAAADIGCLGVVDYLDPGRRELAVLSALTSVTTIVACQNPSTPTRIRYYCSSSDVKMYIVAEFQSGAVFNQSSTSPNKTAADASEVNTWVTQTVTTYGEDVVGDVEAVLLQVVNIVATGTDTDLGARELGSTDDYFPTETICGMHWLIVPVDSDGKYETYASGKADPFTAWIQILEIGYIKKGSYVGVTDPPDLGLSTTSGFEELDLSTDAPNSHVAVVRYDHPDEAADVKIAHVRADGGSDGRFVRERTLTFMPVTLDENQLAEYSKDDADTDFWVVGYEDQTPQGTNRIVLDTGSICMDTGSICMG